ncbi:riboflavin biosynthesis RibT protein [Scopulibacillus daqui]|uniref:Riboflavin biosynthesis RibT protein n=1 Tax=Scopulibacillus daqui TaxID=1469162 RepID=A0ABS2PZ91_9BACL|nr:GNAT family N-acetyltransferase [Scopulibacillus daqui]MBM7645347.1 riboflavin biosynthesis RibT protein [Scopulibacillus daqui]
MLIRYKKSYEKIAMGLLSFVPTEKDLKKLRQTMKRYDEENDWQLFLWREEDIIGIIGVKLEGNRAEIHHVSVNPSYRGQGVGKKMVDSLHRIIGEKYTIIPAKQVSDFYESCIKK